MKDERYAMCDTWRRLIGAAVLSAVLAACQPGPPTITNTAAAPAYTAVITPTATRAPTARPLVTPALPTPEPFPPPFPVSVGEDFWLIEQAGKKILIRFDTAIWFSTSLSERIPLFYDGGPVLVHRRIGECVLSLVFGGGVPFEWTIDGEEALLGEHAFEKRSFRDEAGQLLMVIYDGLFRVTFGDGPDDCVQEAETVLSTIQTAQ